LISQEISDFNYYLKIYEQKDIIRILGGSVVGLLVYLPLAQILGFNSLNDIKKLIIKK